MTIAEILLCVLIKRDNTEVPEAYLTVVANELRWLMKIVLPDGKEAVFFLWIARTGAAAVWAEGGDRSALSPRR